MKAGECAYCKRHPPRKKSFEYGLERLALGNSLTHVTQSRHSTASYQGDQYYVATRLICTARPIDQYISSRPQPCRERQVASHLPTSTPSPQWPPSNINGHKHKNHHSLRCIGEKSSTIYSAYCCLQSSTAKIRSSTSSRRAAANCYLKALVDTAIILDLNTPSPRLQSLPNFEPTQTQMAISTIRGGSLIHALHHLDLPPAHSATSSEHNKPHLINHNEQTPTTR